MRSLVPVLLLTAAACGSPTLETRTFELQHLDPGIAGDMVRPYVYDDRPGAAGMLSVFPGGLTVRETPDNLERIARVLTERDRPRPAVVLNFQLIQADGPAGSDPRIAEVEAVLRDLFRFDGYRLLSESRMGAVEGGSSSQMIRGPEGGDDPGYLLSAVVRRVQGTLERGSIDLHVELMAPSVGRAITTDMNVPAGQTVVLGSAQPDPDRGALILTVRPELVAVDSAR